MIKRTLLLFTAIIMALTGLSLSAQSASAEPGGRDRKACVTKAEYKAIDGGMTRHEVAAIFDTTGQTLYANWDMQGRDHWRVYKPCKSFTRHAVVVWFDDYSFANGGNGALRAYDLYLSQMTYN
jgi:hypothetical protein